MTINKEDQQKIFCSAILSNNNLFTKKDYLKMVNEIPEPLRLEIKADRLVRKHTAFNSMQDMIRCSIEYSYRPTLYCYAARTAQDRLEIKFIANYFDACMAGLEIAKEHIKYSVVIAMDDIINDININNEAKEMNNDNMNNMNNNMNSCVQALQLMGIKYKIIDGDYNVIFIPEQDDTLNEIEIASRLRRIRRVLHDNGIDIEINIIDAGYIIKR
jgi:hypothetical protein